VEMTRPKMGTLTYFRKMGTLTNFPQGNR